MLGTVTPQLSSHLIVLSQPETLRCRELATETISNFKKYEILWKWLFFTGNSALSVNDKNIVTRANGESVEQDNQGTLVWLY